MAYKRINITLPEELLFELNDAATKEYLKRSLYIREAIILKLQLESAVENEVLDHDSMFRLLSRLHSSRMIRRQSNKTSPLNLN